MPIASNCANDKRMFGAGHLIELAVLNQSQTRKADPIFDVGDCLSDGEHHCKRLFDPPLVLGAGLSNVRNNRIARDFFPWSAQRNISDTLLRFRDREVTTVGPKG